MHQQPHPAHQDLSPHHSAPISYATYHPGPYVTQVINTLVREPVPGRAAAAHCSFQTDLCGYNWPLDQPFPHQPSVAVHHSPVAHMAMRQPEYPQHHLPGAHPQPYHQPQNGAVHMHAHAQQADSAHMASAPSSGHGAFAGLCNGVMPLSQGREPVHLPEAGAAPALESVEQRQQAYGTTAARDLAGEVPPSPPLSPPPELGAMLFDFDQFEHGLLSDGQAGHKHDSDSLDPDDVLGLEGIYSSEDFFKFLTSDGDGGRPTITTHLHRWTEPAAGQSHPTTPHVRNDHAHVHPSAFLEPAAKVQRLEGMNGTHDTVNGLSNGCKRVAGMMAPESQQDMALTADN